MHTNDPANRRLRLTVSADLEELLASEPKRLWFDRITGTEPVTRTVSLKGTRLDSVTIKSIRIASAVPDDAYTWVLNDARPKGLRSVTIDVTLHPDKIIPGKFNHTLQIDSDLEIGGSIQVRLSGEILGPLSFTPPRILFGNYIENEAMQETVTIQSNTGTPFAIREIVSEDSEVTVSEPGTASLDRHEVTVFFTPRKDRERLHTRLRIRTDLENQSEMYLDVHGFRKRQPKKMTPRAVY